MVGKHYIVTTTLQLPSQYNFIIVGPLFEKKQKRQEKQINKETASSNICLQSKDCHFRYILKIITQHKYIFYIVTFDILTEIEFHVKQMDRINLSCFHFIRVNSWRSAVPDSWHHVG